MIAVLLLLTAVSPTAPAAPHALMLEVGAGVGASKFAPTAVLAEAGLRAGVGVRWGSVLETGLRLRTGLLTDPNLLGLADAAFVVGGRWELSDGIDVALSAGPEGTLAISHAFNPLGAALGVAVDVGARFRLSNQSLLGVGLAVDASSFLNVRGMLYGSYRWELPF